MHTYAIQYGNRKEDTVTINVKNIYDLQEVYNAVREAVGGVNTIAALCVEKVVAGMFQVVA